jgi:hypothetical protein
MAIPVETASAYLKAGLSVLLAVKARKRPAVGAWKTWSQRLPTDIEVEAWFSNGHEALCVISGAVSLNLECIDFDQKAEAYPAWCAKVDSSLLASLVVESTPSGGKHVVYRCEGKVEGNEKLAQGVRDGKIATLIETRGEAGLFLCAPSPGYTLEHGDFAHIPTIPQEAREALLSAARELDEQPPAEARESAPAPAVAVPAPSSAGFLTRPGDDFASRGDPRPYLLAHGWTLCGEKNDGNELWTRPGKDARAGHSATLKDGVFFVFSSNASPFEPNRGYNAYQVYALLEHANDFKAATAALIDMGYGAKDTTADVDISAILSDTICAESTRPDADREDDCADREEECADPGPIPEHLFDVPGFVSELMGYTLRTAPYPNRALAFAGAFALLGHLSGRKYKDEYDTRPNLYFLSLAASGTGKQHPRGVNVSLAALKGFASEMGDYFASGEGLEDSFITNPCMFYQIDEADTLFNTVRMKDTRAEMISSMLLRMYSESNSVHIMRKKALQRGQPASSSSIIQPHLTFLGTAVPKFFYASLSERVMANGLLARCLVLEAGKRGEANDNAVAEEFPERVLSDITDLIRIGHENALFSEFPQTRTVPMEARAKLLLKDVRREADAMYAKYDQSSNANECALALWARAGEKVSKFALVRAISQDVNAPVIREEDIGWARTLVFHATRRMLFMAGLYAYDGEFDRQMKRVMQRITAKGGSLSYRNILRFVRMEKDELKRVLETLIARGDLRVEKGARGGDVFVAG